MNHNVEVALEDIIRVDGNDREVVGISRYTSPVLNWVVWELKPPRGKTRSYILKMYGRCYEIERTEKSEEELQEEGFRAAQEGEAQMALVGSSESDVSDCEFTYFRADENTIAMVVDSRQGEETLIGTRMEEGRVDTDPE
ncbi:MAG: hypothetical protein R6V19_06985 [Armatimonadota bacterium]